MTRHKVITANTVQPIHEHDVIHRTETKREDKLLPSSHRELGSVGTARNRTWNATSLSSWRGVSKVGPARCSELVAANTIQPIQEGDAIRRSETIREDTLRASPYRTSQKNSTGKQNNVRILNRSTQHISIWSPEPIVQYFNCRGKNRCSERQRHHAVTLSDSADSREQRSSQIQRTYKRGARLSSGPTHLRAAVAGKLACTAILAPTNIIAEADHNSAVSTRRVNVNSLPSPNTTEKEGISNIRSPFTSGTSWKNNAQKAGARQSNIDQTQGSYPLRAAPTIAHHQRAYQDRKMSPAVTWILNLLRGPCHPPLASTKCETTLALPGSLVLQKKETRSSGSR